MLVRSCTPFVVIVIFWLYAVLPFWEPGIANPDDMLISIYKLIELDRCWKSGIFYPRIAADFAFGYGVTLFQFYHPLVSYVAEIFHLMSLGPIEAVKATFSFGLLLSGLGMYAYALTILRTKPGALLAAIAYMYAPYQLLNVYERGALAESFALGLLPLILWSFDRLYKKREPAYLVTASVTLGALIAAHHITALFFMPLLLAYLAFLVIRATQVRALLLSTVAVLLGLGISAFYWLPALLEKGHTYLNTVMLRHGSSPASQLLNPSDVVQHSLVFDYWGPSRFRLGLVSALLVLIALGLSVFRPKEVRRSLFFFGAVLVLCLGLQLRGAYLFWERVPLVQFILFPWRLLSFVSLSAALLLGSIPGSVTTLGQKLRPTIRGTPRLLSRGQWILVGIIALLIVLTSTLKLSPSLSPLWINLSNEEIDLPSLFEAGRFIARDVIADFQPIWTEEYLPPIAEGRLRQEGPQIVSSPASLKIEVVEHGAQYFDLRTSSAQPFPLRFHLFYFPGWQAYVDGARVDTHPSTPLGLVTLALPSGEHRIVLRFEDTPIRRASMLLSSLTLCALLVVCIYRWRIGLLVGSLALLLLIGLVAWHIWPFVFTQFPSPAEANLGGKVKLLGYALDKSTYSPGDTVGVTLYWLGLREMSEDYTVFVHLVGDNDTRKFGQHDGWPVYNLTPTTRWEPGEIVVDRHEFTIEAETPPGQYRIFVGMYLLSTMRRLEVLDAKMPVLENAVLLPQVTIHEVTR